MFFNLLRKKFRTRKSRLRTKLRLADRLRTVDEIILFRKKMILEYSTADRTGRKDASYYKGVVDTIKWLLKEPNGKS